MYNSYILTKNSINFRFNGMDCTVTADHKNFKEIRDKLLNENYKGASNLILGKRLEIQKFGGFKLNQFKQLEYDGAIIPEGLMNIIFKFKEKKLSFDPFENFWKRLRNNCSERVKNELFRFIQNCGFSITEDGCFIAYKRITHDFKDVKSKKFDNSIGKIVSMPREEVSDDSSVACAKGLHVAAYSYLANYSGDRIIEVKVDPADVVSIPTDYNDSKMRVCKYKVIKEFEMGNNPHVNIEEVVKDPVYLDDEDFSKVKNFKRIAVKTFKVKRISKGRLLLKKEIMQNFGLKKNDWVYATIAEDKIICFKKEFQDYQVKYKVDSDLNIRLSKSFLDQISENKQFKVSFEEEKIVISKL